MNQTVDPNAANQGKHIFISYKTEDREYAYALVKALRANDYDVWIDVKSIPGSSEWEKEIKAAIDSAYLVIIIMTPRAEESQWVTREKNEALNRKKPVLPLLREGSVWFSLNNIQFVDVQNAPLDDPLPPKGYATLLYYAPRALAPDLHQRAESGNSSTLLRLVPELIEWAEKVNSPRAHAARELLQTLATQPDSKLQRLAQAGLESLPPLPEGELPLPPPPPPARRLSCLLHSH